MTETNEQKIKGAISILLKHCPKELKNIVVFPNDELVYKMFAKRNGALQYWQGYTVIPNEDYKVLKEIKEQANALSRSKFGYHTQYTEGKCCDFSDIQELKGTDSDLRVNGGGYVVIRLEKTTPLDIVEQKCFEITKFIHECISNELIKRKKTA